jgi:recombination DNA repair RAD52 pathway protein
MSNDLALINESDLSLVENNSLNASQLSLILKNTPKQYVHQRPAKGGGNWDYVTGGYVKKCLNLMFGWDWSFEIIDQQIIHKEVVVKGKLTCNSNGKTIIKMQFGNKDIIYKKGTEEPLSIGNDMKAAATDCLKKCAAEIGIAADIYNKEDFRPVQVVETEDILTQIKDLFELKRGSMKPEDIEHAERIISEQETKSYSKLLKQLKSL